MHKKLILGALLPIAALTVHVPSVRAEKAHLSPQQALYRRDSWGWLEKKFIYEVDEQVNSWLSTAKRLGSAGISAVALGGTSFLGAGAVC